MSEPALFDTHIHLQDIQNLTSVIFKTAGIERCICVSAQPKDWPKVAAVSEQYRKVVVPAFAVHPWYATEVASNWADVLETSIQKHPTALIGECGFDKLKGPAFEKQKEIFDIQLGLAKKYRRALLIHAVKAWEWLDDYWPKMPEKFVFHSFNGRPEQVKLILKADGYIAVNGSILKNKTATEILRMIPSNRLLLESDAPYQTPITDLRNLCRQIAAIRAENEDILAQKLYENGEELIAHD